ncbi:MAG: methyltransferase domain-containing protein [Phycisphaerales bacterium JB059]
MYTTTADVERFRESVERLVGIGQTPIALYGAGRVARQLEPGRVEGPIVGIIDDDASRHGSSWAGLRVISLDEAVAAGVRGVIITAEGKMQDAIWARRSRLREHGMQVLCCPPRFGGRTWDECLIHEQDHLTAKANGVEHEYGQTYPTPGDPGAAWLREPLVGVLRPGMTVCEIGCGSGRWTAHAIEASGRYYAVDYSERLLFEVMEHRFCAYMGGKLRLIHDESARLEGVPDGACDLVFSLDVFVHLKIDLAHQYLRSIGRVLRPGGVALIDFIGWDEAGIAHYEAHFASEHVGGHCILFYNDPAWIERSAARFGMSARVIEREGARFLMRLERRSA